MGKREKYISVLSEIKYILEKDDDFISSGTRDAIEKILFKVSNIEIKNNEPHKTSGAYELPKEIVDADKHFAIFSDGACRGNPGPGSWGALGQLGTGDLFFESSGVDMHTTNNRMELTGAIEACKSMICYFENNEVSLQDEAYKVFLYSDSKYVVDGLSKWVPGWKRRGWKKADKKVPENVELWKELDDLYNQFASLTTVWVRGHAGHPQNERCDELANIALDESGL